MRASSTEPGSALYSSIRAFLVALMLALQCASAGADAPAFDLAPGSELDFSVSGGKHGVNLPGGLHSAHINQSGSFNQIEAIQRGIGHSVQATQIGTENIAAIEQSGLHNIVTLNQNGTGNRANIQQSGAFNAASVVQNGMGNAVDITQAGLLQKIIVMQQGNNNVARVIQGY